MEVSIEADECPALFGLGQREVLIEVDPEWEMRDQVDPATLRIDIANVDRECPSAPKRWPGKPVHLSGVSETGRDGAHKSSIRPHFPPFWICDQAPYAVRRRLGDGRGAYVDDQAQGLLDRIESRSGLARPR